MPRKTLALISGLVLVTVVLFLIAWKTSNPKPSGVQVTPSPVASQQDPAIPAHTLLSLSPLTLDVAAGQQGKVDVTIDTSDNAVTAVQLELQYDPKVISNVQVAPGPLFQNPVVLINKNDSQVGKYTYAFGILPNHATVQGTGTVATVTFTTKGASGKQTTLTLLPESLVTARGVAESVRKDANIPVSATITIGGGAAGDSMMQQQTTTTAPTAAPVVSVTQSQ